MPALHGQHILNLRTFAPPEPDQVRSHQKNCVQKEDPLLGRLETLGAACHNYPVIKIVPAGADDEPVKRQVMGFSDYDKAIVISQHAAQLAGWWLDRYWPMLPVGIDFFAVGPTSAQPLRDQDVSVTVPQLGYSSEALLALPTLNAVQGEKIIIFRGGRGRDLLERTLKERGANVEYCELYSRVADARYREAIAELLQAESPLILIYSVQVLDALLAIVPEAYRVKVKSLPVFTPSERLANLAHSRGFHSVHVAASALPQDMEHSVLGWYTRAR